MEALGEAIENGEVALDEEDDEEAWKIVQKNLNLMGDEVTRVKKKPVKISKEVYESVKNKKREEKEEKEEEKEEEEENDEELLNSEEAIESEEEEEDNENEEGEEEEGEEENEEEEKEEENDENEENEENEEMEEEEQKLTPEEEEEERQRVRERRIALARELLSKRFISVKDFRILDEKKGESSDEESDTEVANKQHSAVVDASDLLGYHKKRRDDIEVGEWGWSHT